jgi:GTPase Era involved in 16S rRNA processing
MNERLKEIRQQAIDYCLDEKNEGMNLRNLSQAVAEKFAELIIEQCMHIVDHEVPGMVGVNCMNKINEHFGLEL